MTSPARSGRERPPTSSSRPISRRWRASSGRGSAAARLPPGPHRHLEAGGGGRGGGPLSRGTGGPRRLPAVRLPGHPGQVSMLAAGDVEMVLFTIQIALLGTALNLVPGTAAALFLARYRGPGKEAIETVLSLPLVLPPTAVGILLLRALARRGLLGTLLG